MVTGDQIVNGPGPFERWVRIPVRGHEPHTGLGRGVIYQLPGAGSIKTASLRKPGCRTGVRLVWLPSLMAYIERRATEPKHEPSASCGEATAPRNGEAQDGK